MAIKAFLLIGQSDDMAHPGGPAEMPAWLDGRVRILRNGRWVPMAGHLGSPGPAFLLDFAKAYLQDHPDDIAGLIPCTDEEGGPEDWEPGGALYDNALFQLRQARRSAGIAGVLWLPGKTDDSNPDRPRRDHGRIEALFASLRRDGRLPGVPFSIGEPGPGRRSYDAWRAIDERDRASGRDLFPEAVLESHRVTMTDGKGLFTIVKKPTAKGRHPVIFKRTPYATPEEDGETLLKSDTRDYVVVEQQCRGTARSEGEFIPYADERSDGLATLDWIRRQPFYNGEIYPKGSSYLSSVHHAYLDTRPADVPTADLAVQDCNPYNILFKNGFFKTGLAGSWCARHYKPTANAERCFCEETFLTRPTAGITKAIFGEYEKTLEECMLHERPDDPFWRSQEGGSHYRDAIRAFGKPLLLTTAFYDLYTEGIFALWRSLPEAIRKESAMIVTPYAHDYEGNSAACHFENSFLASRCPDVGLAWFDHIRGKAPLPDFLKPGKIVYFPVFGREWRYSETLPNGGRIWRLYLNPDRTLGRDPGPASPLTYLYNPAAPARFRGGVCDGWGGMQEQDKPDSRYDIKSFLSAPIEGEHLMEGGGEVRLHVCSDRPDTCFYVRLSIVKANRRTWALRDDITSLRFQHPGYRAGENATLDFTFAPHAFRLGKGDRLRLDVSSSCYPYYLPHTNRPGVQALQTGTNLARNTVMLGLSELILHETPDD